MSDSTSSSAPSSEDASTGQPASDVASPGDPAVLADPRPGPGHEPADGVHTTKPPQPKGRLVEGVRLIFIALLGTAGYTIGIEGARVALSSARLALYVFMGAAVGYVIGGVLGRLTARAVTGMERELRRTPPAQLAAGTVGLVLGLSIAALLTFPLFRLPATAAWPAVVFTYLAFGSLGYGLARARADELFGLVGLKPRVAGAAGGDVIVVDTSALIDGRIADLANTGFVSGTLLLHEGVLRELQAISDSSDPRRRTRGRQGLDILAELQRNPTVEVSLVEEAGVRDVDAALVRLARERGGQLITVDANLSKVAEAVRVPVMHVNGLAAAFRLPVSPGDDLSIHLVKEGREHDQAVGYLDDGTMVVVESAKQRIGDDVSIRVTNVIQTTTGRMIFAALGGAEA
ncbi:MAG: PIN domain nuclease [Actinomycetota bacterium]